MPTRKTPIDVSEYLPDEATAKAIMAGPAKYNKDVEPELRARLEQLRSQGGSSPNIMRVAPPSVTEYVPPTEVPSTGAENDTVPRAEAKVELALPPSTTDYPTQPSLKRLEGEHDVPGVVKGPSGSPSAQAREDVPRRGLQGVSPRTAAVAVLAVVVPVLIVIVLMGREIRKAERTGAASAPTAVSPSARQSMPLPATPTAAPKPALSVAPAPSIEPSATPTATASPAAPLPRGATPKHPPRREPEDPYDAPPTPPSSAAATAAPPTATAPAPTAPPVIAPSVPSTGPSAPAQKPEF